jgi:hypothetical protein
MDWAATEDRNGSAAVLAFGAYQIGTRLRVGLLLVQAGQQAETVTLVSGDGQHEITARLPVEAIDNTGHARFIFEELEITHD